MVSFESEKKRNATMARSKALKLAIANDDKEALSAFGRAGATKTNAIKAGKAEERKYFKEKEAGQDEQMRREANEHIVPIDPDDARGAV
jgi:hypothetical protein